tara:strand:- start:336 stop:992 length:657 start_codon:yes stop_codon:yes gene_type:complete
MDKVLPIWKPINISSYDIIRKIKSINNTFKIGHCGTLDPFAEGIVLVCTGKYTKKVETYMDYDKTYIAEIILGVETDTLDHTGIPIKKNSSTIKLCKRDIIKVLSNYIGDINQIPPYFSAKKINGVKMYDFARNDIFIRKKPFKVRVNSIDLLEYSNNFIIIEVNCCRGTYIRSLARDIAYDLNTYGHLSKLQRFSIGEFNKDNSISLNQLESCISTN